MSFLFFSISLFVAISFIWFKSFFSRIFLPFFSVLLVVFWRFEVGFLDLGGVPAGFWMAAVCFEKGRDAEIAVDDL